MASIQDIFDQYILRAQQLLEEGKLKDAYDLCTKVLETDPEYAPALKLKEKLVESVQGVNQRTIDEKLKALKPLWEEGDYPQIIKELNELYRYAPHYEPLESALAQAEALYRNATAKNEKATLESYRKQLDDLLAAKKYPEMIELMQGKNREALSNTDLKNTQDMYRDKIIEQKINEKTGLFQSEKYDDIVNFLYQLQQIERTNKRVEELLRKYRGNLLISQVSDKQEFVLRATENMNTLFQIGKFEKAYQVAEEILEIDPGNPVAKTMRKKAKTKYGKQLQEETENQIASNYDETKPQYTENKSAYISL